MSSERRRAPRYQLIADAEIVDPHSKQRFKARTSDVSLVGSYMNTSQSLPAGTEIQVSVTHQETTFSAKGQVAQSGSTMGIGVSFANLKADQRAILRKWLMDLSRTESFQTV